MRSKLQLIATMVTAIFLIMGGIPIAYGQQSSIGTSQQSGGGNIQQNSPANAQPNGAETTQQKSVRSFDKQFVASAMQDGMLEVAVSKEAAAKSASKDVQSFANQMIQGYSKSNDQLRQIAEKEGLPVPTTMDAEHQSKLQKFSKLNGSKLDDAYMKFAIGSHQKAINLFTNETKEGNDQDLKTFASQTLPTLQHHLSMAESVNKKIASHKSPWWEFWKRA